MAILSIHRERITPIELADPFGSEASDSTWWDPFADLSEPELLEPRMDFNPLFDVRETDDAIIVRADVPGVHEADIDITLSDNRLVVSGRRDPESGEETGTYYSCERAYGSFSRTFFLPDTIDADQCIAELNEGVLHVVVPKSYAAAARAAGKQAQH